MFFGIPQKKEGYRGGYKNPRYQRMESPKLGLEWVTRLELVMSAWKAKVFPLHHTHTGTEVFDSTTQWR